MRITPLDVRKQEFRKVVRGLDPEEVYAFLATVADEYETVLTDNKQLRDRVLELDEKVAEYRNMEKTLRDTLLTAERVMAEARENARKEAELIVRDANIKAQQESTNYAQQAETLRSQVRELRNQRDAFLARLRGLADSQIGLVESFARDFADDDDRAHAPASASRPVMPIAPAPTPNESSSSDSTSQGTGDDQWRDYRPGLRGGPGPAVAPEPSAVPEPVESPRDDEPSSRTEGPMVIETPQPALVDDFVSQPELTSNQASMVAEQGALHEIVAAPIASPADPVVTGVDEHPDPYEYALESPYGSEESSVRNGFGNIEEHVAETVAGVAADAGFASLDFEAPASDVGELSAFGGDDTTPDGPIAPSGHPQESVAPYADSDAHAPTPIAPSETPNAPAELEPSMASSPAEESSKEPKQSRWSIARFTRGLGDF